MNAQPGTVTSIVPLLVQLDSSATAVPSLRLASYTPVIGDRCAVLRLGSQILSIGKVA
jgi:hypothetical protein